MFKIITSVLLSLNIMSLIYTMFKEAFSGRLRGEIVIYFGFIITCIMALVCIWG